LRIQVNGEAINLLRPASTHVIITAMLNKEQIRALIKEQKLVEGYIDAEIQLTPNGFDLTAGGIFEFDSSGALDFSNTQRRLPAGSALAVRKDAPDEAFGWWHLKKGGYKVVTNEVVNLPCDLIGIAFPRSSLLRMGAFVHNGVWDAGFKGRSEFILVVENPYGIKVKQNARLVQLVFLPIGRVKEGYQGIYQNL
jgi:dUTP pyrophosphatase